jgi:hypothetical protein
MTVKSESFSGWRLKMGGKLSKANPFTAMIESEHEMNLEMAKNTVKDAEYNAAQRRKQGQRLIKEQIAQVGSSGIEMEGTIVDVIEEDNEEVVLEAMNISYSGKMRASEIKRKSSLQRRGAYLDLLKDGATMAASSGAFKGGGSTASQGGFDSRSTGTNKFTLSENSSASGRSYGDIA